jgi:PAS domain-containing protein
MLRTGHRGYGAGLAALTENGVQTPIIILTGSDDPKVDLEATELGAADFLIKDQLDPVMLERVIRYSVQHAATLQALQKSHERFRLLFERSLDAILISDDRGPFRGGQWRGLPLAGVEPRAIVGMEMERPAGQGVAAP